MRLCGLRVRPSLPLLIAIRLHPGRQALRFGEWISHERPKVISPKCHHLARHVVRELAQDVRFPGRDRIDLDSFAGISHFDSRQVIEMTYGKDP